MNTALGFGYAALIIYLANLVMQGGFRVEVLRWMLLGLCLLLGMIGLTVLQEAGSVIALLTSITIVLGAVTAGMFTLHAPTRQQLRRWLPAHVTYQPDSIMHTAAIVFILFQVLFTLAIFQLSGGQAGLAEMLADNPPTVGDAIFSGGVYTLLALGGVGFYLRRSLPETIQRLGLDRLSPTAALVAVGAALLMQVASMAFTAVWVSVTPPDVVAQQQAAGNAIALASVGSLWTILITAGAAAIGEEILFRGALQPVFGLALTTLMFTFVHTQYLGSPALLFIALMGAALGWLRIKYGTIAAIIAHFLFNLISLQIASLGVA